METTVKVIAGAVLVIVVGLLITAGVLLSAWVLMWAWNIALVPLFGAPTITFVQAVGIDFLIMIVKGLLSVTVNHKK